MTLRRTAPFIFVALCLGLSALVLRRQIAAHPVSRISETQADQSLYPKTWHIATGAARREVLDTVEGQLAALRTGNADKAMSYQSQVLRRNFRTSEEFERMITSQYPEFGHSRSVECGPVGADATGRLAGVIVTVTGEDGRQARGLYQLVREEGSYKVIGVKGGHAIN